jgi:hypothetical protein
MQYYNQKEINLKADYHDRQKEAILTGLKTAPSRVANIEGICLAFGDCPSCPECLCADFLGPEWVTAAGLVATTPFLLATKLAMVVS